MTEEWEENPNEFVTEDGELVEIPEGVGDRQTWLVHEIYAAKLQKKEWDSYIYRLQRMILEGMEDKKAVYDGLSASVRGGWQRHKVNVKALADVLYDMEEVSRADLCQVIAAASSEISKKRFPEQLLPVYEQFDEPSLQSLSVVVSPVMRAAPRRKAS